MELAVLVLLGGVLALDGTSVGQFMLSRPLVAGVLAGWVLGEPGQGLVMGGLLELFYLAMFPVGGARFPEGGPAAVVATATSLVAPGPPGLALGTLLGLAWGQVGGYSMTVLRVLNARLVPDPGRGPVSPGRVVVGHLGPILLDFLRGCVLTGVGVALGVGAAERAWAHWPLSGQATTGLLLLGASVCLGSLLRSFGGWGRRRRLFLAGLLAGLAGALLL